MNRILITVKAITPVDVPNPVELRNKINRLLLEVFGVELVQIEIAKIDKVHTFTRDETISPT